MENKNIIILVLIVVIVIAILVGIFATMSHVNKQDTNLTFKSNSTITEGDSIKIRLTDANGTGIANQTINVTIRDKDKFSDYHSVVTDKKGSGTLKLDKKPGKYEIIISYEGNDNYTGSNATKKVKIEEKVVKSESTTEDTSSSSTSSDGDYYYYLDSNGKTQMHMTPEREAQERENFYANAPSGPLV